jgi:hypothetical protein
MERGITDHAWNIGELVSAHGEDEMFEKLYL